MKKSSSSNNSKKSMKGSFHRIIEVMDAMDTMVVIDRMSTMIFYEILDSKKESIGRGEI